MPKVNRNAPCPCGSGKKYKNCCMRKDQAIESRELGLVPEEGYLLDRLYQYAQSPRFRGDLVNALNFFWGGVFDYGGDAPVLSQVDIRRTMEWFVFDYHSSTDRRLVVDLFVETQANEYTPEAKEILNAWSHSVGGLFRVLSRSQDTLSLYDPLQQESLEAKDASLARSALNGDLLVGRLFELRGAKRLSLMTLALPGAFEPDLVVYLSNAYDSYRGQHYQANWDEFLRENGHIFNAYLLSPRVMSLRSLIGPGTRYHDPSVSRDRLVEYTSRRESERQQQEAEPEQQLPGYRSASGIILPDSMAAAQPAPAREEPPARPTILLPGRDF
jgi:hypothetical protein